MFDFVHENKKLIQIVLALIVLPFAFWGVDSYRQSSGESIATVNGEKISQQEFDNALRQQQDRMREMLGDKFDPAVLDKPEIRTSVLDGLINQRVLMQQARTAGLVVNDEQLAQVIAGIEAFQKDGQFDKQLYEAALRSQGMTPAVFEERVRRELGMSELTDSYARNGYASGMVTEKVVRLSTQQRMVSTILLGPDAFLGQQSVGEQAIKDYYDKNASEFQLPERARVEYVSFSVDSLLPRMKADEAEVKAYYDEHQAEFGTQEQRQAAHILIAVSPQASDADKQAARAKAEQVLQQVRQAPDKFADLARQYSQDPGSAAQGGDLGMFGRGMMVKPFEEAAYKLKPGEISGLVQSDFGFHIIKLLSVVSANVRPLAAVRDGIEQKIRQQRAADKFAELAEKFGNAVYEQSDSLKPAAELVGMPVQQSDWLSKGQPAAAPWTDKALQAVFSAEVVKDKRNSAAIETGPNALLAVRMLEYKPASVRSLGEVSDSIRQKLVRQQALEQAVKQGKSVLAQLQRGEHPKLEWRPAQPVIYAQAVRQDRDLGRQMFQVDPAKLPAYVGAESAQGYLLVRVEAVKDVPFDESKRANYEKQLRDLTGEELMQAFLADSRKRADVSIRTPASAAK